VDEAGTLGNRTALRFEGGFALTAIDNDLFPRPSLLSKALAFVELTGGQSERVEATS